MRPIAERRTDTYGIKGMKRNRTLLVGLLILIGINVPPALAGELPDGVSKDAIQKQDKWVRIQWPYLSQFIDKYPAYRAASYCQGSFTHERFYEGAMLLVNPDNGSGKYVAVIGKDAKTARVVELGDVQIAFTQSSWEAVLHCYSYTELLRLDTEITEPGSLLEGGIQPISTLDGICVWYGRERKNSNPNICYGFDRKKAQFVEIGGWLT